MNIYQGVRQVYSLSLAIFNVHMDEILQEWNKGTSTEIMQEHKYR